jgi:hypothetical protein
LQPESVGTGSVPSIDQPTADRTESRFLTLETKSHMPHLATELQSYRATELQEDIMGYRRPETVVAPKTRWTLGEVLCNTGQGGWSAAEGSWDDNPALAMRWNGDDDSGSPGNPQSHGNPTWFIVPEELHDAVRDVARSLKQAMELVVCETTRPEGFDHGVFKATIRLNDASLADHVVFEIPELPKRFFRHERDYSLPPNGPGMPWKGRFVDGLWEGIVQTNGINEDDNPTTIHVVRDALVASVMKTLKPWRETSS